MFTQAEKATLKLAKSFILRELELEGVARVDGFGEFSVRNFTYRGLTTQEMEKTKTVRFRPFTAAKRAAKASLPPKPKMSKIVQAKKVPVAKPESQTLTPSETYVEVPKKKPVRKPSGFSFTLGKK